MDRRHPADVLEHTAERLEHTVEVLEELREAWQAEWAARPRLRGWSHVAAAPAAVAASVVLARRRDPSWRPALIVHGMGLAAMFTASASYHRLTRRYETYRFARAVDHGAIFLAIAGTATPFAVTSLPAPAVRPVLVALWGSAALAAAARIRSVLTGRPGAMWEFAAVSTLAGALAPAVAVRHGPITLALVAAGGVAYVGGAVVFTQARWHPVPAWVGHHEVWHAATIVGAALHFAAIASATRDR